MDQQRSVAIVHVARLLLVVIAIEMTGAAWLVGRQMLRPDAPSPDLGKLDAGEAERLLRLRQHVRNGSSSHWRRLAQGYLGNRYYSAAEQCFHRATELNPDDVRSVYYRAFCLGQVGRTSEAIPLLEQVSRTGNQQMHQSCWYQIGQMYLREQNPGDAEAAFRKIVDFPSAAFQLAKILIRTDRSQEAIPIIEQYLSLHPDSLKFVQLRAQAARNMGDEMKAWEYRLREDISIRRLGLKFGTGLMQQYESNDISKRLETCRQLSEAGDLRQYALCLDSVLARIREGELWNYPSVFIAAAAAQLDLQHPERTIQLLNEVARFANESARTVEMRGDALLQQGHTEQARQAWQRAANMLPSPELYVKLAHAAATGQDTELEQQHQAAARFLEGLNAYRSNQLDDARSLLLEATELAPDNANTWYYLGVVHTLIGEQLEAADAWNRCLKINPDHGRAIAARRDAASGAGSSAR